MSRCYCGTSDVDPEDVDLVRDGTPICTATCLAFYNRDHRPVEQFDFYAPTRYARPIA